MGPSSTSLPTAAPFFNTSPLRDTGFTTRDLARRFVTIDQVQEGAKSLNRDNQHIKVPFSEVGVSRLDRGMLAPGKRKFAFPRQD